MATRITTDPGSQHPEPWRRDLNPEPLAGMNHGEGGPHPEWDARTAYDYKDVHDRLSGWNDADLKNVRILPEGSRLEQGATYFDLNHPEKGEFTARGDMSAGPNEHLVLKSAVEYTLWNRLLEAFKPAAPRSRRS